MGLRQWSDVPYIPILALNGAEMQALEELPGQDKDALFPFIQLKSWATAANLEKALTRVRKAYGDRPYIADLCLAGPGENPKRDVFKELAALRLSKNGYSNWCDFIAARDNLVPTLQLRDINQLAEQADRLHKLGRGLVVHVTKHILSNASALAKLVGTSTDQGRDVCFILDFGRQDEDFLINQAVTVSLIKSLRTEAPNVSIAISASSFPSSFVGLKEQPIYERDHFNGVRTSSADTELIYSDRGSARAEKQVGGGGSPAPRIDYAGGLKWSFFRSDSVKLALRPAAYVAQAKAAIAAPCWDKALHVWGCQMIEKTSKSAVDGIRSQHVAAAARINIHLHRQLLHDDPGALYDTDEDWVD